MRFDRWTNPSLPQTLQIAVFLLYANAVLGLLFGEFLALPPFGALVLAGSVLAGLGIANEKKWGWRLGVGLAGAHVALLLWLLGLAALSIGGIFELMFPVALFALLVHPQSRDYQRIWFS